MSLCVCKLNLNSAQLLRSAACCLHLFSRLFPLLISSLSTAGDLNARDIMTAAVDTVEEIAIFRMSGVSSREL